VAREKLRFQAFLKLIFRAFFRLCAKIRVIGLENIPDHPPYVVFSNHISWYDPVLVSSFMPDPVHIMAMEGLFAFPPLGFLMRSVGAFPVSRGSLDRRAIEGAIDILTNEGVVFIFPEGGIGRLERGDQMRPGISLIAQRTNVPLVPIGISGCRGLYNPIKLLLRRVTVTIRIGKPFISSSLANLTGKKMRMAAMDRIRSELCALTEREALLV